MKLLWEDCYTDWTCLEASTATASQAQCLPDRFPGHRISSSRSMHTSGQEVRQLSTAAITNSVGAQPDWRLVWKEQSLGLQGWCVFREHWQANTAVMAGGSNTTLQGHDLQS